MAWCGVRRSPDWQAIDLDAEGVRVLVNGAEIKRATGNPAGDMMRLLVWMANEGARWAGGLKRRAIRDHRIVDGEGFRAARARSVRMVFDRCGSVEAHLPHDSGADRRRRPRAVGQLRPACWPRPGYTVALAARRTDKLAALASETGASLHACDATDPAAVAALFDALPTPGIVLLQRQLPGARAVRGARSGRGREDAAPSAPSPASWWRSRRRGGCWRPGRAGLSC